MWIPLILGGTALFWYLGKEDDSSYSEIPESLAEHMVSKPSDWSEVVTAPKRVVKSNNDYLSALPTYSSKDVWGVQDGDIFDDFKASFRRKDPFLLNCSRGVFLIDPQGSGYARYVSKVG